MFFVQIGHDGVYLGDDPRTGLHLTSTSLITRSFRPMGERVAAIRNFKISKIKAMNFFNLQSDHICRSEGGGPAERGGVLRREKSIERRTVERRTASF